MHISVGIGKYNYPHPYKIPLEQFNTIEATGAGVWSVTNVCRPTDCGQLLMPERNDVHYLFYKKKS